MTVQFLECRKSLVLPVIFMLSEEGIKIIFKGMILCCEEMEVLGSSAS